MRDYIKRVLIAIIMALCVSLLFLGGKHPQAAEMNLNELTAHWIWPSDGVITDTFGTRHGQHKGMDIAGEVNTPIHTVDSGIVMKSYFSQTYGNVVFVKHPNNLETVYAHLSERLVKEGQKVKQGDLIGKMGNTGQSSGVHLHLEVHVSEWTYEKENALDPIMVLGEVDLGTPVQAFAKKNSDPAVVTISPAKSGEENIITSSVKKEQKLESKNDERHNGTTQHTVQSGETLWSIANKYGVSLDTLKKINNLSSDVIKNNQKLTIASTFVQKHVVKNGESLTSISRKYRVSINEIRITNSLNSDIIFPDQILTIKKKE
ncbi:MULTISPECIES: M23 family metallopeptidase [unclassified Bacillus (in: firmicutes)]|uniref:M23 family metallopeptidase n=1 Tax=unclassified Bacillus (in: firmicutes) TaxID=185979 RepID=UPI0008E242DD|nr:MULTISPECIES: M23 family metallopeptidase [unclassified Bacillus (in: firmicutes)]SFA98082.1 LysM domain-containing protein [Bacillus sp. UNCCL13]SFQ80811.1 LysM domain-containing protein [Bacillus sp. cl95]